MSFENPGFESFEQNEKTKEQLIQEIKDLGGFENPEARNIFADWLEQRDAKEAESISYFSDEERLEQCIDIAEILYSGGAPIQDVIDAYFEALADAVGKGLVEKAEFIKNEMNKIDPDKKNKRHSNPGFHE